jgi:TM2 domain-containing membrane protein YozV
VNDKKNSRPSRDAFYYALVYPGIGHFLLGRPVFGLIFAALATAFAVLFFIEFWAQIRLFMQQASAAIGDANAPLPEVHYGRMLGGMFIWILCLTGVYAVSLVDVWRRVKPRPPPVPPLPL